jgi:hypothetical protein
MNGENRGDSTNMNTDSNLITDLRDDSSTIY